MINRRDALQVLSGAALAGALPALADEPKAGGCVVGQPEAAQAGREVLDAGGNAVDAIVAAALAAGVAAPQQTGFGGYGGHMTLALVAKNKVTCIDFNSVAPSAARPDMFPLAENGSVKGGVNVHGWLAFGVPGIPAGLQLAIDRYGSQPFRKLVQPAIRLARDGIKVEAGLANAIRSAKAQLLNDPASARLLLDHGEAPKPGAILRNPDLAHLLETLAEQNSVEAFYRGAIARRFVAEVQKHGGLLTADDLAAYQAREVEPLRVDWNGFSIRTAPLTAGGLTVLQALNTLKELGIVRPGGRHSGKSAHARLEALRLAWNDRLALLGDPQKSDVPIRRLLSAEHAKRQAALVEAAVAGGKMAPARTDNRPAGGTIHLSAWDTHGNMAALTLTHGGAFGAQVTIEGLGLTLGHGMSRFEPRPGHPNSVGPGKRPLHNMCPTIVLKGDRPVLAVGGRGGRKIPNSVFEVLLQFVGLGATPEDSIAAGRLHTEGGATVSLDPKCAEADAAYLKQVGYTVEHGASAVVSAVAIDSMVGGCRGLSR